MTKTIAVADYLGSTGQVLGASSWRTVDQELINQFAALTGDEQFIHTNPQLAAFTPFGGTIAHGFLILSLFSSMAYEAIPGVEGAKMSLNYGFDRLRFVAPVREGRRVRAVFVLASAERTKRGLQSIYDVTVEIEGEDKPAVVAAWVNLLVF